MNKLWASSLFVVELVASGVGDGSRTNHGHPKHKVLGDDRSGVRNFRHTVEMATAEGLSIGSELYASVVTRLISGHLCSCDVVMYDWHTRTPGWCGCSSCTCWFGGGCQDNNNALILSHHEFHWNFFSKSNCSLTCIRSKLRLLFIRPFILVQSHTSQANQLILNVTGRYRRNECYWELS